MDKRASLLQWFAATAEAKLKAVQDYLRLTNDHSLSCLLKPIVLALMESSTKLFLIPCSAMISKYAITLLPRDLLSSDKKFLVFCHHQTMMKVTTNVT